MLKVLVVEDEPDLCELIATELTEEGHDVACAADGALALSMTAETLYDVVLADVRLPKLDGLTLLRRIPKCAPTTDTIVMTGHANIAAAVAILKEGAFDYLTKPVRIDELGIQMSRLETFRRLHRDLRDARAKLAETTAADKLVGHSPEIQRLTTRLAAVAPSDASVVIVGESGTGKELVAQALHEGAPALRRPSWRSTARRSPTRCSRRSCSVTNGGRSRARPTAGWDDSRRPTAGRCFSTRWRSSPRPRR